MSSAPLAVALSGGADSLALAAALAFEAAKPGHPVVALIVDHGLQSQSARVAQEAAEQAVRLGLTARVLPVVVDAEGDGVESAARRARYRALRAAADEQGIGHVFLGHTLDDQAETVLLGLARGAGAASLQGMATVRHAEDGGEVSWLRPFLSVRRATTRAACEAQGLAVWDDPHNDDESFARVRVRSRAIPELERCLGPGVVEALGRTAEQLREDNEAFAEMIAETIEDIVEPAEAGIAISVDALAANPAAIRNRIIRTVVQAEFGVSLTRTQTLEVARLVTDWAGQGPIDLPGCRASRRAAPRRIIEIVARG